MAIRFRCSACSQPIEIDDEWASKTVACPYCRKTVTAPDTSTLDDLSQIPMATPVLGEATTPAPSTFASTNTIPSNPIAVVAMILACCSIAMLVAGRVILDRHPDEMREFKEAVTAGASLNEQMSAQTKFFETHPGAERWFFPAMMLLIGSGLASLIAIVCGIIGLRRLTRRGLALAALLIAGPIPIFMCCGGAIMG